MQRTFRLAGVEVPRIGLGTNRLDDSPEAVAFVREAVAADVRHIDTAHLYTGGASERAVGAALAGAEEDLVVATKGGYGGAGQGRPEVLRAQIEQSLQALRTDVIALYYLHRVDPETPLEESLGTIREYVERGAIRHVGISDVTVQQIEQARSVLPIAAVQNRFNVEDQGYDDVVEHCEAEGIAFVAYYPLHGPASLSNQEKLAWLLDRAPNVLPIPGTRSPAHLRENLAVLERD
jgi:aryl-alcohol dehydrogenase-like predicted oxidoreductase